jgi:cell division protein FtsB
MKRFQIRWRTIVVIAGLAALVLLVRDFNSRMAELHRLTVERDRVAATVTSMAATYNALETQVALATADLLVEEIARESLKYSKEGDHPIILLEGEAAEAENSPQAAAVIQPVERWQLWLALFVDLQIPSAPGAP